MFNFHEPNYTCNLMHIFSFTRIWNAFNTFIILVTFRKKRNGKSKKFDDISFKSMIDNVSIFYNGFKINNAVILGN